MIRAVGHNRRGSNRRPLSEFSIYSFFFLAGGTICALALPWTSAAPAAAWWAAVLIVIRSDLATLTIPDEASLAIAALGCLQAYLRTGGAGSPSELLVALSRGSIAFSVFWLVRVGYRRWRGREGLGFGDVKLAGACAIWLAPSDQIVALEIAAASAAALTLLKDTRERRALIPFGAFLAPAAWLVFVARAWFEIS
jgi:prepilin signal peptidase PulO-like enzyme (type II secretory pathway)